MQQQAAEAVETLSPAEERFNRARATLGLAAAPVTLLALLAAPLPLPPQPHRMAAILAAVVVLWITEALPIG
jgi:sodium-dependent dicarboxylate transporter 2/3/5